jgi:ApeA N-terminal domain 1
MQKQREVVFEKRGYFWWNECSVDDERFAPEGAAPGYLVIDERGVTTLRLDGSILKSEFPGGLPFLPDQVNLGERSIAGRVTDGGVRVYLLGLTLNNYHRQSNGDLTSEEYKGNSCLVGEPFSRALPDSLLFPKQLINLRGLEEWYRGSAIETVLTDAEGAKIIEEVKYSLALNRYEVEGGELVLRSVVNRSPILGIARTRKVVFEQEDWLDYLPESAVTPGEMATAFRAIEEFLALLIGSYYDLEWPLLVCGEGTQESWFTHYFERNITQSSPPDWWRLWTVFPQVRQKFGELFTAWKRKRDEHDPGVYLYLGSLRSSSMYIEHRFTSLIWGIESLHRKRAPDQEKLRKANDQIDKILAHVRAGGDDESYEWLQGKLKYAAEPTLEERVFKVFDSLPLGLNTKKKKKMMRRFAADCANRRNDISHFGGSRQGEDYEAFLRILIRLSNAISYLYHAVLLCEMGLEEGLLTGCFSKLPISYRIREALGQVGITIEQLDEPRLNRDEAANEDGGPSAELEGVLDGQALDL